MWNSSWFESHITSLSQKLKINGSRSEMMLLLYVIDQGTTLGPILLILIFGILSCTRIEFQN